MANGAKPLSRQLSHALESIQQQQSNTRSLKFKKAIRALQDQTDDDQEMPQEYLDALGPEIVAMLPCLTAMGGDGMEMEMGDDGGDGGDDGLDNDENNILAFLDDYNDDACEATGICDFSIIKDEEKIKCDENGGKIIMNDILFCKEDMDADMDMIIYNAPVCFPQVCPDDSNAMELTAMGVKMFMIILAMMFGTDLTEIDMEEIPMVGTKEECASGTRLAISDTKDTKSSKAPKAPSSKTPKAPKAPSSKAPKTPKTPKTTKAPKITKAPSSKAPKDPSSKAPKSLKSTSAPVPAPGPGAAAPAETSSGHGINSMGETTAVASMIVAGFVWFA